MSKKFEFSKLILCLVMLTYFIGLGFGMYIILKINPSFTATALCGLFSYIGAPVAVAIGFYAYKAKAENVEKIKQNTENYNMDEKIVIDETYADA